MDLLRLFFGASVSPLAQARTAGPLAVDTGPPVPGAPPFSTEVLQKEVTATELKPQAQILDLLETILPTIFAGIDQPAKSEANGLESIALNLGELKAKVELPEFNDILVAMGVPLPTGFEAKTPQDFKLAVSQAVVDVALPAPVKSFLAHVVAGLDSTARSEVTRSAQRAVSPLGELVEPVDVSILGIPAKPVYDGVQGGDVRTMPPVFVGEQQGVIRTMPPVFVGEDQSVVRTMPPVLVHVQGKPAPLRSSMDPTPTTRSETVTSLNPFAARNWKGKLGTTEEPTLRSETIRSAHFGDRIEPSVVRALNVTGIDATQTESIDLSTAVAFARESTLLQKAPVRQLQDGQPTVAGVTPKPNSPVARRLSPDRSDSDILFQARPTAVEKEVPAPSPVSESPVDEGGETTMLDDDDAVEGIDRSIEQDSDVLATNDRTATVIAERPVRRSEHVTKPDSLPTTEQVQATKQKLIEQIEEIAATRKNGRVTIKLSPDDLGSITLAVRSIGNEIETKVTASNENVRHALQAHRADLVQSVESRGLTMNSFTVGSEAPQDQQSQQRQDHPNRQDFARTNNLWAHKNETLAKPTYPRLSHAGVDTLA